MPTTNKPMTFDGQSHRQMTDAEFAQWQEDVVSEAERQQVATDAAKARATALAKLEALGLTPAEVAALVGA